MPVTHGSQRAQRTAVVLTVRLPGLDVAIDGIHDRRSRPRVVEDGRTGQLPVHRGLAYPRLTMMRG